MVNWTFGDYTPSSDQAIHSINHHIVGGVLGGSFHGPTVLVVNVSAMYKWDRPLNGDFNSHQGYYPLVN